jgi:ATP-dependent DNA helicase RecQ
VHEPRREVLDGIARDALGIDALRSDQRDAAAWAVGGRDVLAVMPTGSGKS